MSGVSHSILLRFILVSAVLLIGCSDGVGVLPVGRTVFVTSGESHELTVVDGGIGRVVERTQLPSFTWRASLSADSALLYIASGDLMAFDTRSRKLRWRETLSTTIVPRLDRWRGVGVSADAAIANSPDGRQLFMAPAFEGDTLGFAVLDAETRDLVAFVEPFFVEAHGLIPLPPGPGAPAGTLLLFGRREAYPLPRTDWLYTIDLGTFAVRDSAAIVDVPEGAGRFLGLPVLAPDRASVYLMVLAGTAGIYKYDLVERRVVASAPLESDRPFVVSPDGESLYQVRNAQSVYDQATELLVYDAELQLRDRIELSEVGGAAPDVRDAPSVSPDSRRVYVASGTSSRVLDTGSGSQAGWLQAVDPMAKRVVWSTPLGIWAPDRLFVR